MSERVSYKEMVDLYNQGFNKLELKFNELSMQIHNVDQKLSKKIEDVIIQTTKTNGRVYHLESKEQEINRMIECLKLENKEQNNKIIRYGILIAVIVTVISITTGIVIPFL